MPASDDAPIPSPPHRLYVHIAWATLARVESIPKTRRATIETHMLAACRRLDVEPIEARVLADRVHLLVRLPAVVSVGQLAGRVRDDVASRLAAAGHVVRWTPGFAAITVSPREVRRVRKRLAVIETVPDRRTVRAGRHQAPSTPASIRS
jgi:REP element-mobilizing transposase RayT